MKRIIAIIAALALIVCVLAACGEEITQNGNGNNSAQTNDDKSVVLTDVMAEINSKYDLGDLKKLESVSDLKRYYKIAEEDVKQFAAEMSTSASKFNEVIIVEAVDGDAADRVLTQLFNHLDTQMNTAKSYSQDELDMIEKCSAMQNRNFVFLVICEDAAAINDIIDNATR